MANSKIPLVAECRCNICQNKHTVGGCYQNTFDNRIRALKLKNLTLFEVSTKLKRFHFI